MKSNIQKPNEYALFDRPWLITSIKYLTIGILLIYILLSTSYLSLPNQTILGCSFLFFVIIFAKNKDRFGQIGRISIMVLCLFLTIRYLVFRITVTLYYDGAMHFAFALLLFFAEVYGMTIYIFGMFVNVWPVKRSPPPIPEDNSELPTVDVYIPTYNEPSEIVKITALACTQMFYPKDKVAIYILDDGGTYEKLNNPDKEKSDDAKRRSDELKKIANDLSIYYSTRDKNINAKAGNINEVLMNCECYFDEDSFEKVSCVNNDIQKGCRELILILDCDHIPTRDFLQNTVGFFLKDPQLYLLQTPHFFINPNPVEKNLDILKDGPGETEMFYGAIHPGLDFWNASFFCGSAAVVRRKYIMEVGGIAGNTITEDAETSLLLHNKGYKSAYLNKPMVIGLAPEIFTDFIVQRSRWAQGMIQIFIMKNPLFQKGLTFSQKLCYFNTCLFWFFGIARIIFFMSPLFLLIFGLRTYNASLEQVLAYVLPHLIGANILSNFLFGKFRRPFFSELYETIQSIYLLPAIFSVIFNPRAPVFKVTPKNVSLRNEFLSHLAAPFYLMLIIAFTGYGFAFYNIFRYPLILDSVVICVVWNTFNIILLLSCLGVVWEKRQIRNMHRYNTHESIQLEAGKHMISADIVDLSIAGAGISVETDFINKNTHPLIIHAKDSYGVEYNLPVEIQNIIEDGNKLKLGCTFLTDKIPFTDIVNFVYGDSSRWQFYDQQKKSDNISVLSGLFRLLIIGIYGFIANIKGVLPIILKAIFKQSGIKNILLRNRNKEIT